MTEQDIKELMDKYTSLVEQARDATIVACKLEAYRDVAFKELHEALLKLFDEDPKYHCSHCGNKMNLCSEPYLEEDEMAYYLQCSHCHSRTPLVYDELVALLDWFGTCSDKEVKGNE